jgi:hypothetical protein
MKLTKKFLLLFWVFAYFSGLTVFNGLTVVINEPSPSPIRPAEAEELVIRGSLCMVQN